LIELSAQLAEVVVGLACGVQLAQTREGPFLFGEVVLQSRPFRGGENGCVIDHAVAELGAGMVGTAGRPGQKILDVNQRKTAGGAREVVRGSRPPRTIQPQSISNCTSAGSVSLSSTSYPTLPGWAMNSKS